MGIRVDEEDEIAGLDVSQHGERAYIFGGSGPGAGHPRGDPVHMRRRHRRRGRRRSRNHDRATDGPLARGLLRNEED